MLINWFPEDLIPLPGRLGLTHLPGARGNATLISMHFNQPV